MNPEEFGRYLAGASSEEKRGWLQRGGVDLNAPVVDVLLGCLIVDPMQRPNPLQLIAHPWMAPAIVAAVPAERRERSTSENIMSASWPLPSKCWKDSSKFSTEAT